MSKAMRHVCLGAGQGRRSCEADGEGAEWQYFLDFGRGERESSEFHMVGVSAARPHEGEQQGDKEQEGGGLEDEEETFEKLPGESAEKVLREMSQEGVGAKVEAVPSKRRRRRSALWITQCLGVGVHTV